jgi:hypothetical protein
MAAIKNFRVFITSYLPPEIMVVALFLLDPWGVNDRLTNSRLTRITSELSPPYLFFYFIFCFD